ncbi:MAG TPA: HD domain-containing protein [Acetomicrobium flavidum]|uniref:HD domain-containing phosphohydrolase n=1 Tax=Acetomicrobium flavidum TaxID=49896 RepID=UPI002C902830|nr:HD domain-containing protein [Acetomicrobium flavidum]
MNDRLKTQEALEKEKAFLGYLFHNNPEAIVLTDQNNHVIEVNESFCRTFGYSKDESVGKHIDELVAIGTHFYEEATDMSLRVSSGSMVDVESMRRKKDGTLFEVAITAVPVIFKDKFLGIYTIYRDISDKKRAERKIREYVDYLKRVWIQTISALGSALEKRDLFTAGHQRRVAKLARAIATRLNLAEEDVEAIYMASLVHDIGKIKIPAEILSKPASLMPEEYMLVKTHPKVGFDILSEIEFPWPIAEIVYQHHERLDGSGYPRGLRGEEIHRLARVIAVADVVEAIMSDRPHRKGRPAEVAMQEIKALKGKHFDPDVVEACVSLFELDGFTFDD